MEAVTGRHLLEIEKELAGSGRREALRRHDAVLAALDKRISEAMDAGLSTEEYQKVQALRETNVLARKLLRLAVREADET